MGKGDKRGKPKLSDLAIAPVQKRQPNGQARERRTIPCDPRKTALEARCRIFGIAPTKANMLKLSAQRGCGPVGMLIERLASKRQAPAIWTIWQGFCAAERTYRLRYLGQSGTAKGATIAMVPDRVETDQSHSVDLRDSDQRDRDAANNWANWRGYLMHLPNAAQKLILDAELERGAELWARGKPTRTGQRTFDALEQLANLANK